MGGRPRSAAFWGRAEHVKVLLWMRCEGRAKRICRWSGYGMWEEEGSQYDAKAFGLSNEFTELTLTNIGKVMARMAVMRIQGLLFS